MMILQKKTKKETLQDLIEKYENDNEKKEK